jgi:hypothetical protein
MRASAANAAAFETGSAFAFTTRANSDAGT